MVRCNVILNVICLIYLTLCMAERENILLEKNNTENLKKSFSDKSLSQEKSDKQLFDDVVTSFLSKDKTLAILDIPFTDNQGAIDVLKAAVGSIDAIKDATKNRTVSKAGDSTSNDSGNKTQVADASNRNDEEVVKTISSFFTRNTSTAVLSVLNITFAYNEKPTFIVVNKTKTKDDKMVNREMQQGSDINYNLEPFKTTDNLNTAMNVATTTDNSANVQTPTNDSILSDIINLSCNDGEALIVGQKIEFQRSNMTTKNLDTNSPGMEILKNISETCGSLFGKRISFANETTLMEFPWSALLLYNTSIRYHCGGSLITEKYVLTAAHCVAQEFYELIGVRLGEHDITKAIDCAPDIVGEEICATTIDVNVVKIIVHHAYSHLSFKNDIALLKLDKHYIRRSYYPICIPTPDMTYSDTKAIVAGWGATEKALRSSVLLKADVPIYDISKCREIYRYNVFNDSTEICGSGENEVDVCKGDSGGALFYNINIKGKDKYYQLGIISLGVRRCGDKRFLPAVFTKLSGFYKWIENNLEY